MYQHRDWQGALLDFLQTKWFVLAVTMRNI